MAPPINTNARIRAEGAYGFRHLGRDYRRMMASLALWLVVRLTPKQDGETHSAIYQLAKAMRRTQG